MSTDRALLEAAARAAGYEIHDTCGDGAIWAYPKGARLDHDGELPIFKWGPLTDDGDSARLEAKLMLDVRWWPDDVTVGPISEMYADHDGDKHKARRYAGVRAAAAIGSTK